MDMFQTNITDKNRPGVMVFLYLESQNLQDLVKCKVSLGWFKVKYLGFPLRSGNSLQE